MCRKHLPIGFEIESSSNTVCTEEDTVAELEQSNEVIVQYFRCVFLHISDGKTRGSNS